MAGFFEPWAGPAFASEDIAVCGADDHDAPGAGCTCGFRAADDPQNLLDLINPPLEALGGAALLDVADHLHAPVRWAEPKLAEAVRLHLERRCALPQLAGPLASERRVSALRMGQLGFEPASALRVDRRRMLRLRTDAPAPQRPTAAAVVPIRRTVGLGLELIATTAEVHRLDAQLARSRPPLLGVREEHVATIRGRRHLPQRRAAVAR